ncbi:methylmalonyl-CoA mutase family protein [Paenibacillus sp. TRM 82003]|nr:methylmalonyl-CoA mutase family protein [Paenibacillus sp. TRM 82003]
MKRPEEQAGEYPFTRGIYPRMYRDRLWTMRQYAGYGSAKDTNRRLKRLLALGQTGLSLAFDLPTQLGLDPDDERAAGEVGKTGVSAPTLASFESALRGIPLAETSLSMTINATAPALFAMMAAVSSRQGVAPDRLYGTIQNDVLKEYAARNLYVLPPEPSFRMAVDLIEYSSKHYPRFHPVSVSGYHMREAGADASMEIGFTLANGIAYVEAAAARGLPVDDIAPKLSFLFSASTDLFEEIAKFRAARRLWARLMRERCGARRAEAWRMKFHAQTAGSSLTTAQPDNNVVRVTLQALAAVLGGAQSVHTNGKDEAFRLPSVASAALALRTQQIIAYESGVADRVDPLGGSFEIEALTDRLERDALGWIREIDRVGGALHAVRNGFVQTNIREAAFRDYQAVERGERVVVGVNRFAERRQSMSGVRRSNRDTGRVELEATEALKRCRAERSDTDAQRARHALLQTAEREENIMTTMNDAVKAGCTIGELYGDLADLYGWYQESETGFP